MSLAPIQDMGLIKLPQDGSNEVFNRLNDNMKYFVVNYIILLVLLTTITLSVINPLFLIVVAVLAGIAAFFLINKNPIKLGEGGDYLKIALLSRIYLGIALVLYASVGGVNFLIALLVSFILCCIHAIICEIEATRSVKSLHSNAKKAVETAKSTGDGPLPSFDYIIARGYELLCVAIGLKESGEVYNGAAIPGAIASEIKQDLKNIKANVKELFQ